MEVLLVSDRILQINSHKGPYKAIFCNNGIEYLIKNPPKKNLHLIIDQKVADLYKDELSDVLSHNSVLIIEALEANKSIECMPKYISYLVSNKIRKDDVLIAIGGGIIQDITCFLAAILLRGLDWYFYPTTLLSQADSCIGSKSSINCGNSKNLLGTFTPPNKIVIGRNFLKTLDECDVRSGVGEMLKVHGIDGIDSFEDISSKYDQLFYDDDTMQFFIHRSLEIKKQYIEIDEFDQGVRNIFNYGHSFGHAIEAATNFNIPHGIAVTIGLDMANWLSPQIGNGAMNNYERMTNVLKKNSRGYENIDIPIALFMDALSKDKKNLGIGEVTLIMPDDMAKIQKGFYANDDRLLSLCEKYLTSLRF
jgi:3-dehydroquinate synthase